MIATLAGVKIGAQLIVLDPACGATQLHAALAQYGVSLLIVTPSFQGVDTLATLGAICPELGTSPRGQIHAQMLPMLRVVVALGVKRPSGAYNWGDLLHWETRFVPWRCARVRRSSMPRTSSRLCSAAMPARGCRVRA